MMRAMICGCAATELGEQERAFFASVRPWGLILFARNIESPDQVRRLVADFRAATGRADAPVFIDQEGGRVQRLRPPHWRAWPPAARLGALFAAQPLRGLAAARLTGWLLASELAELGISSGCFPVLDVPAPGAHEIIGDRAFATDPLVITALARAFAQGARAAGIAAVVKHIPGHGRARADSHKALPVVDAPLEELRHTDFLPFAAFADAPMAMTAHVVYAAIDKSAPATHSPAVIEGVIRGEIGFSGLLMSDDLDMQALSGPLSERARKALDAGCDVVLHCSGDLAAMEEVAAACPPLRGQALRRAEAALGHMRPAAALMPPRAEAERALQALLA